MKHNYYRLHAHSMAWHYFVQELVLVVVLAVLIVVVPVSAAAMRFQERSLYMESSEPGVSTSYQLSWRYMSPEPVGSVDMLFCMDPIPYHTCISPPGLDVSKAVLSQQDGETGYSIRSQTANHIVLTRTPSPTTASGPSTYTFDNITNPAENDHAFAIRLRSHASTDASGPQIDFGSIRGQVTQSIQIQTQVPPMLIFCVAEEVADNCTSTNDVFYRDTGILEPQSTLTAQSQMAVGTNASGGFAITAIGSPLSAGTSVIDSSPEPVSSQPGSNQFAINLVANDSPAVGRDPEGAWTNAVVASDYSQPNRYKYVSGDLVAYSPNVSLMKKFTVSYIINSDENLPAGVYSTTITYIASGRF